NNVQQLRAAVAARSQGRPGETADALTALDAALAPLDGSAGVFGLAHRDLGRRLNDQLVGDLAPTASVVAGVDTPCAAVDKGLETLRRLETTNVVDINARLAREGGEALPAWTPPAAPACGR